MRNNLFSSLLMVCFCGCSQNKTETIMQNPETTEKNIVNKLFSMEVYKQPTFEMQPIEDYKLVFFAEGRLVALMQNSKDPRVRENTALWAKFNRGEGIETLFCNRYFYIPKGETEFKVY